MPSFSQSIWVTTMEAFILLSGLCLFLMAMSALPWRARVNGKVGSVYTGDDLSVVA
jgi:hypothetical protein